MKTNVELKRIASEALKNEYGFAPAQKDIVLLECNRDGTYIMFEVRGKQYQFNSYIMTVAGCEGTIWAGNGTISRYND